MLSGDEFYGDDITSGLTFEDRVAAELRRAEARDLRCDTCATPLGQPGEREFKVVPQYGGRPTMLMVCSQCWEKVP